jgi:two-component system LytT family response regulator
MRVFIADDEPLALRSMEKLLKEIEGIEVIGKYQDPRKVLDAASRDKPDLIFLDIEMPVLSGLEVAERLSQTEPTIKIVFVTAFSEYAVNAFELNALDYLLKPVRKDRVIKALQRIRENMEAPILAPSATGFVRLRLFQNLQIEFPMQEPQPIRWRTAKAQELFIYLLQRNGQTVRKDSLITMIWPDYDLEKAYTNLYTTVYQLRKTLNQHNLNMRIMSGDEGYILEKGEIVIDVEEWELGIKQLSPITEDSIQAHHEIMRLYRDAYLKEYDFEWADSERQRLSLLWFNHAVAITDFLMNSQDFSAAISLCHKIQEHYPFASHSYFTLMKIYAVSGDSIAVKEQYERFCNLLSDELGESPESDMTEWFEKWKNK